MQTKIKVLNNIRKKSVNMKTNFLVLNSAYKFSLYKQEFLCSTLKNKCVEKSLIIKTNLYAQHREIFEPRKLGFFSVKLLQNLPLPKNFGVVELDAFALAWVCDKKEREKKTINKI